MHPIFHSAYWSIADTHIDNFAALITQAITAGPVDEAENLGLPIEKIGNVAVVKTFGPVIKVAGWAARYGLAGIRETQMSLVSAANDNDVDEILWLMDSPGGTVDGLEEFAQIARQVNAEKKITVQVDGILASAGYYMASSASQIFAAPDNLIGSIGVRTALYDFSKLYEEAGVKVIPVDTGDHKSTGLRGAPVTDAQIAETQRIVDGYMNSFRNVISNGRNLNEKQIDAIADGRVFFPRESVKKGLIDGERTMADAMNAVQLSSRKKSRRSARQAALEIIELGA